jgi:hypothetical protein
MLFLPPEIEFLPVATDKDYDLIERTHLRQRHGGAKPPLRTIDRTFPGHSFPNVNGFVVTNVDWP